MNKKVCIKGDGSFETGKRIIEYLEGLGGVNKQSLSGGLNVYYFIDHLNAIGCKNVLPYAHELITILEPTQKTMTIDEIKKEKAELEQSISKLMTDFCDKTEISDISIDLVSHKSQYKIMQVKANITIEI